MFNSSVLDKIDDELKKVQKEFTDNCEELLFLTKNFDNLEELKELMVKAMKD